MARSRATGGKPQKRSYTRADGTKRVYWTAHVDLNTTRRGQRDRPQRSFDTRGDALDWMAEQRAARDAGHVKARRSPTVADTLADFVQHGLTTRRWSPSHHERTARIIDGHLSPLADILVDELTVRDVESVLERAQAKGNGPNSIRLIRNALVAALNIAMRRGTVDRNVAALTEGPRLRPHTPTLFTPEQIPDFFREVEGERLAPLWRTALTMMMRPSEVLGLRWPDIDLGGATMTIAQGSQYVEGEYRTLDLKTASSARELHLPAAMVALLRDVWQQQIAAEADPEWTNPERYVFTNTTGGPVYEPHVNRRMRLVLTRANERDEEPAGLPLPKFRELRHSGATLALSLGVPLERVSEHLGHVNLQTTRRYAKIMEPMRVEDAATLDTWLRAHA